MTLHRILEHLTRGGFAPLNAIALLAATLFALTLLILLPRGERRYVRGPITLLILYVICTFLSKVLTTELRDPLYYLGIFFLLASFGRSGFLLVLHSIVLRRLSRPLPKIFRDVIQALVFLAIAFVTLGRAGVEFGSLLTTSALLTAVIGLSLQDTLGNLFAGLAIQAQRPFEMGDWVQFDENPDHVGRVVEMNWRAVKLVTLDAVEVTVPNSTLAKAPIRNFTQPTAVARRTISVIAPYEVPPRKVHQLIRDATVDVPGILGDSPPVVFTRDFTDRGIEYLVRYFVEDFSNRELVAGQVRDRLWYALSRADIRFPAPARTVRLHEINPESMKREQEARVRTRERALRVVDFLRALPEEARNRLAEVSRTRMYAPGELIVHQGELGDELFIIEHGEVQVLVDRNHDGDFAEVSRIGPGKFFGEMSVMTGEPRKATVKALQETEVLVVSRRALQPILESTPELAEQISHVLAEREEQLDTTHEEAHNAQTSSQEDRKRALGDRIRQFFSL